MRVWLVMNCEVHEMNDSLKRTPLADEHIAAGARMVDFGGWSMPLQYAGLVEEHNTVRQKVGLFDVSHMGEIRVTGAGAEAFLDTITVNDVSKLNDGQAHYTVLPNENGGIIDDLLIYRFASENYLLVVNASTQDNDLAWILKHAANFDVTVASESDQTGQIAIQGPLAQSVLQRLVSVDLAEIAYYHFTETQVAGVSTLVSRTGYTGEDGFECYVPADQTAALWRRFMEEGKAEGIQPAGLGARDTLRLEARMHLYGNDMNDTITPLEAGLGWVTKMKKASDFIGKAALAAQKKAKVTRKLIGFEMVDRGIARHDYPVVDADGNQIGVVTSGTYGPTLKKAIGLAYVPSAMSKADTIISIKIRNKVATARVVKGPFYTRS